VVGLSADAPAGGAVVEAVGEVVPPGSGGGAFHSSSWLFPGRHAGQPAEYSSIAAQLREHGLPLRTARISALRQLVLQVPAPVVADAIGFHHHTTTTTRQHVNAGATWSHYVAGSRPSPQGQR
jgi:hypothetical protein